MCGSFFGRLLFFSFFSFLAFLLFECRLEDLRRCRCREELELLGSGSEDDCDSDSGLPSAMANGLALVGGTTRLASSLRTAPMEFAAFRFKVVSLVRVRVVVEDLEKIFTR